MAFLLPELALGIEALVEAGAVATEAGAAATEAGAVAADAGLATEALTTAGTEAAAAEAATADVVATSADAVAGETTAQTELAINEGVLQPVRAGGTIAAEEAEVTTESLIPESVKEGIGELAKTTGAVLAGEQLQKITDVKEKTPEFFEDPDFGRESFFIRPGDITFTETEEGLPVKISTKRRVAGRTGIKRKENVPTFLPRFKKLDRILKNRPDLGFVFPKSPMTGQPFVPRNREQNEQIWKKLSSVKGLEGIEKIAMGSEMIGPLMPTERAEIIPFIPQIDSEPLKEMTASELESRFGPDLSGLQQATEQLRGISDIDDEVKDMTEQEFMSEIRKFMMEQGMSFERAQDKALDEVVDDVNEVEDEIFRGERRINTGLFRRLAGLPEAIRPGLDLARFGVDSVGKLVKKIMDAPDKLDKINSVLTIGGKIGEILNSKKAKNAIDNIISDNEKSGLIKLSQRIKGITQAIGVSSDIINALTNEKQAMRKGTGIRDATAVKLREEKLKQQRNRQELNSLNNQVDKRVLNITNEIINKARGPLGGPLQPIPSDEKMKKVTDKDVKDMKDMQIKKKGAQDGNINVNLLIGEGKNKIKVR